jgi:hypothetical protein
MAAVATPVLFELSLLGTAITAAIDQAALVALLARLLYNSFLFVWVLL